MFNIVENVLLIIYRNMNLNFCDIRRYFRSIKLLYVYTFFVMVYIFAIYITTLCCMANHFLDYYDFFWSKLNLQQSIFKAFDINKKNKALYFTRNIFKSCTLLRRWDWCPKDRKMFSVYSVTSKRWKTWWQTMYEANVSRFKVK